MSLKRLFCLTLAKKNRVFIQKDYSFSQNPECSSKKIFTFLKEAVSPNTSHAPSFFVTQSRNLSFQQAISLVGVTQSLFASCNLSTSHATSPRVTQTTSSYATSHPVMQNLLKSRNPLHRLTTLIKPPFPSPLILPFSKYFPSTSQVK